MRADKKLAAATLASLALFGAQKAVQAKAVMVPFFAVGGGWQTIVSYAHDSNLSTNTLHIAYNIKPAGTTGACQHYDGLASTSQNDLTSFFINGIKDKPSAIYGDTGGTYAPTAGPNTTYFGFMVVATEDGAGNADTANSGLAVDTISYNASLRFLYAQRSIDVNHTAASIAVAFSNTGLAPGATTKFMSFAPADSNPYVYAVGVSPSDNLFGAPYAVPLALTKQNNNWWGRLEDRFSDFAQLSDRCVAIWPVCAPSSAPNQGLMQYNNCFAGTFATVGGWFHLQNAQSTSIQAIVFKVESNPAYGYAVTPLHPLQYTTE